MTAKASEAVRALLEHLAILSQRPPSPEELQAAQTFLSDGFLLELETVGSVAQLTARLGVLGLPDDYFDKYRTAVRGLTLGQVATTAGKHYDKVPVIVVAGDAAAIEPSLSLLGPVSVVDPSALGGPRP
jgi:predicted Zn-dependent peptidase